MRIEVFRVAKEDWGVRFAKGFEITGFQSVPMAHVWVLQWIMEMMGKRISDDTLKRMLKEGQKELDQILAKAIKDEEDEKRRKSSENER